MNMANGVTDLQTCLNTRIYGLFASRNVAMALGAIALAACSSELDEQHTASVDEAARWEQVPAGGFYRYVQLGRDKDLPIGMGMDLAGRCWKTGDGFDCILAVSLDLNESVALQGFSLESLPKLETLSLDHKPWRYWCELEQSGFSDYFSEFISGEKSTLTKNTFTAENSNSGWSAEYVEKFVKGNFGESEPGYWPCLEILKVIQQGSVESLRTNLVEHPIQSSS